MIDLTDFAVVGNGVADDTAAVQAALSALLGGDTLQIPAGSYKIDGNLLLTASHVTLVGRGKFIKDGTSGVKPMFILADFVEGVIFDGIRFDGSRASFGNGNGVPAILGHRNSRITVRNCEFANLIDVGVKLRQTFDLEVTGCRFDNIGENGVETRWYENDPRTSQEWAGGVPTCGTVSVHHNSFSRIGRVENQSSGLVDGCAFTADNGQTSRSVRDIQFHGNMVRDCLRGFYSENNPPFLPCYDVRVTDNTLSGHTAAPSVYTKQGVGLINVDGFLIADNIITNWGNYDPYQSSCDGVVLTGNARNGAVRDNNITDRTGNANRMDRGIHLAAASNVTVSGNRVAGSSVAHIYVNSSLCANLTIYDNPGTETEFSWADTFEVEYYTESLAASASGIALRPSGWNADPNTASTGKYALVGVSYRLTAPISAGAISVGPYVSGSLISSMEVNQGDFGGTQYAGKKLTLHSAPMVDNLAGVAVRYITNAGFSGGGGMYAKLVFDRARKL